MTSKRRFGALRRLPSGRWQARYRSAGGGLVTVGKTFATKTDAARFLDSIELDQLRGVWHDPLPSQQETVRAWCRRWLQQHSPSLTPSTAASYDGLLERVVLHRIVDGRQVGLAELSLAALSPMRVGSG
jgi:hypothetical protein